MIRILILFFIFPAFAMADEQNKLSKAAFASQYASLLYLIETGSWEEVSKFEGENIKCGFGPNEDGKGCIRKVYSSNTNCVNRLLFEKSAEISGVR